MDRLIWICILILNESNASGLGASSTRLSYLYPELGFRISKEQNQVLPSKWEQDRVRVLSKNSVFIKSRFHSGLGKEHFYRFTITEEYFSDTSDASVRSASLFAKPPKINLWDDYVFNLRGGYGAGKSVVIIQTDVSAYDSKVPQLRDCLRRIDSTIPGQERKRVIDSVSKVLRKPLE